MFKAALFDLDGVVIDTESQYSIFWEVNGERYLPHIDHLAERIKGMTLTQIFDNYFAGKPEIQKEITDGLNILEKNMSYNYIRGFKDFFADIKAHGIKTAVVTSSNQDKMRNVYRAHPNLKTMFDAILTSEDFDKSKPNPDCYLKAAQRFGLNPDECVGFEDSINGLKAVKAAKMYCVGLATTNPREVVANFADIVIDDYEGFTLDSIKL